MKSLPVKLGVILLVMGVILFINPPNDGFGKDSQDIRNFSQKLQELRNLASELMSDISRLDIAREHDLYFKDLEKKYQANTFTQYIGSINNSLHIYIIQLNEFDPSIERGELKPLKTPEKSSNYCCWKSISLVYMTLCYEIQEFLNLQAVKKTDSLSPQIFHSMINKLRKLQSCLRYFDYFAEYGK